MPEPVPSDARDGQPLPAPPEPAAAGPGARRLLAYIPALIPLAITGAVVLVLLQASHFENFGLAFWSFNTAANGIMVYVTGSFLTSVPALVLAMAIGLAIAIASATYLPGWLATWADPFVDLLAGIPSIVYGIWGWIVIEPFFKADIYPWMTLHLAWLPGFAANRTAPAGDGASVLLAIVILFLMILPVTTLLMRDALRSVPRELWESGLALGATRWEVTRRVSIPYCRRGIWGAAFLGFGRAMGETVAVFMVIGQIARLPTNIYDNTSTMATIIIAEIDTAFEKNAVGYQTLHFLAELALVLMGISLAVNLAGRWMIRRTFTEVAGV